MLVTFPPQKPLYRPDYSSVGRFVFQIMRYPLEKWFFFFKKKQQKLQGTACGQSMSTRVFENLKAIIFKSIPMYPGIT